MANDITTATKNCAIRLGMGKVNVRKLSTEAQQQLRNQAIRLRKAGKTYPAIAEVTGVHQGAIKRWYKVYLNEGMCQDPDGYNLSKYDKLSQARELLQTLIEEYQTS